MVARRDGSLAVLEAGPFDTLWVRRLDVLPHLKKYTDIGRVWIRQRKTPLTAEQSRCLTEFSERADGKRFALIRLGGQLTVFRKRGPLRTYFIGKPEGDKASYFCSELVTEACCAAGILDPERTRPSATYPHDLFFGRSFNPFIDKHLDIQLRLAPAGPLAGRPGEGVLPAGQLTDQPLLRGWRNITRSCRLITMPGLPSGRVPIV